MLRCIIPQKKSRRITTEYPFISARTLAPVGTLIACGYQLNTRVASVLDCKHPVDISCAVEILPPNLASLLKFCCTVNFTFKQRSDIRRQLRIIVIVTIQGDIALF